MVETQEINDIETTVLNTPLIGLVQDVLQLAKNIGFQNAKNIIRDANSLNNSVLKQIKHDVCCEFGIVGSLRKSKDRVIAYSIISRTYFEACKCNKQTFNLSEVARFLGINRSNINVYHNNTFDYCETSKTEKKYIELINKLKNKYNNG